MTKKIKEKIVQSVADNFRSFGGGNYSNMSHNPIAYALKDSPAQFAAGVDIAEVVVFIEKEIKKLNNTINTN